MIYIVIPVFNRWHFTESCLTSLRKQSFHEFKIIVVDHGSTDGTGEYITNHFPNVILLRGDSSMWWTAATNLGVAYALKNKANFILTLNNDLEVNPNYLSELMDAYKTNKKSIIGSMAVDIEHKNSIVYAGIKWNSWIAKYDPVKTNGMPYSLFIKKHKIIETDLLSGRGTLIPKAVFQSIGLFNAEDFPHYMADEDFSLRARKIGYKCFVCTSAVVYSHYKATGLESNQMKNSNALNFLKENLLSIKSPNKISVRWAWAKYNGSIPPLYFLVDFGRVFASLIFKSIRRQFSI